MKSQARKLKRMEARRQDLLREMENRQRMWNAAIAGDVQARIFLSKQYRGMDDEPETHP
jgi:hypothetical protein